MTHPTFEIGSLRDARVLVIGDLMLDSFVYGQVSRISPEAPIPVLLSTTTKSMAGGAANVAVNLAALGAGPVLLGVAAHDAPGMALRNLLERGPHRVVCAMTADTGRPTTLKTRYVAGAQQMLRVDQEQAGAIGPATEDALIAALKANIGAVRILALSDYSKGVLTDRVIREALRIGAAHNIPVIVDPKRADFSIYRGATYIKPNMSELQRATGIVCDSDERVLEAVQLVIKQTGAGVLLTRSEKGMSLFEPARPQQHVRSMVREVYDVSGAGDTALAAFAGALAGGYDAGQAMLMANAAAGIAVSKLGTAVVTAAELSAALNEGIFLEPADRVLGPERAAALCETWRQRGLRIGFTNGCFDILHAGHVSLLSAAAAQCDRLVVGLNSDASVKRLKGPARPAQIEASRAQVLASLDAVDLVVIFGDDTPMELITRLKPDVLVKGADYAENAVVGGDFVKSYGGRVYLARLVEGQSTTNTIKRMTAGSEQGND